MATQHTLEKLSQNVEQLNALKEALDQDIAHAAMACVKAGDPVLMQQLVGSVPNGHEFAPLLIQIALEMRAAKTETMQFDVNAINNRETINRIVYEVTESLTESIENESALRLGLFEVALGFVPAHVLPGLAGAVLDYMKGQLEAGSLESMPQAEIEELEHIRKQGE